MTDDEEWGIKTHLKYKRADWYVSHSEKDGFILRLVATSRFRDIVDNAAENLCALTRHRWCNQWGKVNDWSWKSQIVMAEIPIDRETADKVSWHYDSWTHLDEDDEN